MMTIDKAISILRAQKFKATKPTERKMLPKYMITWDDRKIDEYYKEQENVRQALEIAITSMSAIYNLKKASYDLVDMFDNMKGENND